MYQLLPDTPMGAVTCVKRVADNAVIPADELTIGVTAGFLIHATAAAEL